jgi:hypothetical protein
MILKIRSSSFLLVTMIFFISTTLNPSIAHQFEVSGADPRVLNQNLLSSYPEYRNILGTPYGETQPILWPKTYGPISIGLPAHQDIYYLDHLPYDDEGIIAGYAKIGVRFDNQTDIVEKVIQELSTNSVVANCSEISMGRSTYGLPIATSSNYRANGEQLSVGACRWGQLTLTVTVYGHEVDRVKLILNSIKPPEPSAS